MMLVPERCFNYQMKSMEIVTGEMLKTFWNIFPGNKDDVYSTTSNPPDQWILKIWNAPTFLSLNATKIDFTRDNSNVEWGLENGNLPILQYKNHVGMNCFSVYISQKSRTTEDGGLNTSVIKIRDYRPPEYFYGNNTTNTTYGTPESRGVVCYPETNAHKGYGSSTSSDYAVYRALGLDDNNKNPGVTAAEFNARKNTLIPHTIGLRIGNHRSGAWGLQRYQLIFFWRLLLR